MLRGCTLSAIALALSLSAVAGVWGQTQVLPPPAGLPVTPAPSPGLPAVETSAEPSVLGWQTFVAYRETLRWVGGVVQALVVLLVLSHLAVYGVHRVRPTGRLVRRYGRAEILLHAVLALAFVGAWASSTPARRSGSTSLWRWEASSGSPAGSSTCPPCWVRPRASRSSSCTPSSRWR
jgi:cytochrome b561